MQRFPKLDKIKLPLPPFKCVLILNVLIFSPPFQNPKVWEMWQFNFEKKHSPPQRLFSLILCSGISVNNERVLRRNSWSFGVYLFLYDNNLGLNIPHL